MEIKHSVRLKNQMLRYTTFYCRQCENASARILTYIFVVPTKLQPLIYFYVEEHFTYQHHLCTHHNNMLEWTTEFVPNCSKQCRATKWLTHDLQWQARCWNTKMCFRFVIMIWFDLKSSISSYINFVLFFFILRGAYFSKVVKKNHGISFPKARNNARMTKKTTWKIEKRQPKNRERKRFSQNNFCCNWVARVEIMSLSGILRHSFFLLLLLSSSFSSAVAMLSLEFALELSYIIIIKIEILGNVQSWNL